MKAANSHHSNYVSMTKQERTKEKAKLSNDIKKVSNVISDTKSSISNLTSSILKFRDEISKKKSQVQSLNEIAKKHGDDCIVRWKEDHFKYGQPSNFIKKILHSNRYETERKKASEIMNSSTPGISAKESVSALNKQVNSLQSELQKTKNDFNEEKQLLDDATNIKDDISTKISAIDKIEDDLKKANETKLKARQDFCLVYQSNAGCKALNQEARKVFRKSGTSGFVSGSKVIQEYERVHGSEIFGRGNKDLKYRIKAQCDDLSSLVKEAAKGFYTPSSKTFTTYRGQGMTSEGIELLKESFHANPNTVYSPGQFFSTSSKVGVATDFANRSTDDIKVLFTVKGDSSNGLSVPGGLTFENDEGESLYSPLANFKVTDIEGSGSTYYVSLQETKQQTKGVQLLPY
jgi:uncharacterized protein YoxC